MDLSIEPAVKEMGQITFNVAIVSVEICDWWDVPLIFYWEAIFPLNFYKIQEFCVLEIFLNCHKKIDLRKGSLNVLILELDENGTH